MMIGLSLLLSACIASLLLTPLVRSVAFRLGAVDHPGERKIHTVPVPRLGGVSLVISVAMTIGIWESLGGMGSAQKLEVLLPMLFGGALILLVGIWDDIRPLPAWVKFGFQALAALIAIRSGVLVHQISLLGDRTVELAWFSYPLTFVWIVGITNAFNLVDGLDGLAAGLASIAAGTSAVVFLLAGHLTEGLFLLIVLGALLGFLRYNFNPATIFLGDSGSLLVGYVLAITAVTGTQRSATTLAVLIPLLVFGLPILDTLLSMVRRFVGGSCLPHVTGSPFKTRLLSASRMFHPDQRHIHHRLMDLGFSHRGAVLFLYVIGLGLSCLALLSVLAKYRNAGIILLVVGLATFIGLHKLGYKEIAFLRSGTLLRWYEQLSFNRLFFMGFADLVLIGASYWGAYALKFDTLDLHTSSGWYLDVFPFVLLCQLASFAMFRLYRGIWRAMGVGDLLRISGAVGVGCALSFSLAVVHSPPDHALTFFVVDFFILAGTVTGARSLYRILDHVQQLERTPAGTAVIYGAGRGGQLVLRELLQNDEIGLRPLGFLDDDHDLHGRTINRIPVLGGGDDLRRIHVNRPFTALVISSEKISGERLRRIIEFCRAIEIMVLQGRVRIEPIVQAGALGPPEGLGHHMNGEEDVQKIEEPAQRGRQK